MLYQVFVGVLRSVAIKPNIFLCTFQISLTILYTFLNRQFVLHTDNIQGQQENVLWPNEMTTCSYKWVLQHGLDSDIFIPDAVATNNAIFYLTVRQ